MTDAVAPAARMGVYKHIQDVPDRYRLRHHADAYADRDVWAEWFADRLDSRDLSDQYVETTEVAERSWKTHVADRGRHHALATPDDVEAWVAGLLDGRKLRTVYETYWARLEQFYGWLQTHADHPHVYHPVLMSAAEGGAAGRVWAYKQEALAELAAVRDRRREP